MRRYIAAFITFLMVANLATWPAGVIAEVLEHEQEVTQSEVRTSPAEPSPAQCQHGCTGHYAQHFLWQVPVSPNEPHAAISAAVVTAPEYSPPQHIPALPFRPPLTTPIRS